MIELVFLLRFFKFFSIFIEEKLLKLGKYMKKLLCLLGLAVCCSSLFAYVTAKDIVYRVMPVNQFPVIFSASDLVSQEELPSNLDVPCQIQFGVAQSSGSLIARYTLLQEVKTYPNLDDEDLARQLAYEPLLVNYVKALTGRKIEFKELTRLKEDDAKRKFNADFAFTYFVTEPVARYSEGYHYLMLEFFFKKGIGLVVRGILGNDVMDFLMFDTPFLAAYNGFKFEE